MGKKPAFWFLGSWGQLSLSVLYQASEDLLKEHYTDLKDRPFFSGLVKYMHSGPVVAMVSETVRCPWSDSFGSRAEPVLHFLFGCQVLFIVEETG